MLFLMLFLCCTTQRKEVRSLPPQGCALPVRPERKRVKGLPAYAYSAVSRMIHRQMAVTHAEPYEQKAKEIGCDIPSLLSLSDFF